MPELSRVLEEALQVLLNDTIENGLLGAALLVRRFGGAGHGERASATAMPRGSALVLGFFVSLARWHGWRSAMVQRWHRRPCRPVNLAWGCSHLCRGTTATLVHRVGATSVTARISEAIDSAHPQLTKDVRFYDDILKAVDELIAIIGSINVLTPELHEETNFEALASAVQQRLREGHKPTFDGAAKL